MNYTRKISFAGFIIGFLVAMNIISFYAASNHPGALYWMLLFSMPLLIIVLFLVMRADTEVRG